MPAQEAAMITRDMTIEDVIRKYPQTVEVFRRFGLDCMECQIAEFEAVEHGADVHQVNVENLVEELNKAIKKQF
jgi:hybrid cluster-associated redox disulfide protein